MPAMPPIPTYEEAAGLSPLRSAHGTLPHELPPAYAVVDEKATSYTIYGTFIHTPSGPAYQLSSLLDARINKLGIRRLRAEEVLRLQHHGAYNIPFDPSSALYEMHDPPFVMNEYYIRGKSSTTLPGMLQLRLGLRRWHVCHMPAEGARPVQLMTCGKRGGFGRVIRERRNEMEPRTGRTPRAAYWQPRCCRCRPAARCPPSSCGPASTRRVGSSCLPCGSLGCGRPLARGAVMEERGPTDHDYGLEKTRHAPTTANPLYAQDSAAQSPSPRSSPPSPV